MIAPLTARPRFSRKQFDRALWRAIAPPLLLLAAHAVMLTILCLYWMRANETAVRSERMLTDAATVQQLAFAIDSAARGYRLTNNSALLDSYQQSHEQMGPAMDKLHRLMLQSNNDQKQWGELQTVYQQLSALELRLQSVDSQSTSSAGTAQIVEAQRVLLDQFQRTLTAIVKTQSVTQSENYESEKSTVLAMLLGGITFSLLLGVLLAMINRRTVLDLSQSYHAVLEEQANSNKQLIELANAIPQMVWISDAAGRHVYFNDKWTIQTGLSSHLLQKQGWESLLHPEQQQAVQESWQRSLRSGVAFEQQFRLQSKNAGEYRWFLGRATPVMDAQGQPGQWFGSCTDIDEQKRSESMREASLYAERNARDDLLRASRIKDEFLATLSHELRTPMTAILGWAKLLREPRVREKNLDRAIDAIDSSSRTQARLIDDLLDMSRIMSGKLSIQPEPTDFREIIRAALESAAPAVVNKKIVMNYVYDEDGQFIVLGDAARLQQVTWNLLTNAIKFTPAGGRISVELRHAGATARLRVIDSGRGISPEFLPHVFERFRQADGSITRTSGGLGLGLAIVKNLVELHGGTVHASSPGPDRGATFWFDIPLVDSEAPVNSVDETGQSPDLTGRRVLIVEDDADSAFVLQTIIEQAGAAATIAATGNEALDALGAQPFDLLLSDVGLPGFDGYELVRTVRGMAGAISRIPAIAVTAFARPGDRQAAFDAGFNAHVCKPVTPNEIRAAVAEILPRKKD